MVGFKAKCRIAVVFLFSFWIGLAALYGLLKPVPNGCNMTYMYPTYIPISKPSNVSSEKYGLFLYHEGWKKIDFKEHLMKLSGIPVLFIPGNGGSYKQVRSLAAESDRAYQGGPLEPTFYLEASFTPEERGHAMILEDANGFTSSTQYSCMLDWFAVDLEEEHSAMDGGILEEHAEYVVYAIHRILDQYQESRNARSKEGAETSGSLPRSVILVGHSMGGFVARAAVVHPHLRKSAVETVLTLSSPHQSPPVALQPSLGLLYSRVNSAWRKGYEVQTTRTGQRVSDPLLSDVVVVSVSGGIRDLQVRSKLASLDGIVPPTHGFMIGTTSMKNVWLSMEHQSILWCNQLVIQVSHTLLSLVDPESGQPFGSTQKRLAIFSKLLRSGVPQSFNWMRQLKSSQFSRLNNAGDEKNIVGSSMFSGIYSPCPQSVHWTEETLERDLYIQSTTVTVLAMDGRRRWMDIRKLGSNGKDHFVFVTNLVPCSGVRLHLWPEKTKMSTEEEFSVSNRVLEVTSKMVNIPAGPAPRQIEPGSQTEQAPPSAVLQLGPVDMHGYRFLTISVAPRPTVSGRPPPAASMAVGQFFNPMEGEREFSPKSLILSSYIQEEILLKEDHPLVLNLSFSISVGLLPVTLSLKTTGCGIKKSGLPIEQAGDAEHSSLCKLRCFPPVALLWDSTSGLHVIPNLYSETIIVDSSPVFWGSTHGSDKTTVLLMVDPHCSYKINTAVSTTAAASRFLLLHGSQIIGFCMAVIFFALMRQARAWELDRPLPSILTALESNLRMPLPFLILSVFPVFISMVFSLLASQPVPPFSSFAIVSIICYSVANGSMIILSLSSQMVFYVAASVQVFIKQWWQVWEQKFHITFRHQSRNCFSIFSSFKVLRILGRNQTLVVAVVAVPLVFFVHPALGLFVLLISHASHCHTALCSFLAASFRSHAQRQEKWLDSRTNGDPPGRSKAKSSDSFDPLLPVEESNSTSPNPARSFCDTQLEVFQYQQGLLILHLAAALLLVPSLVAWIQRIGFGQSIPWFVDSALSMGIILHGLCGSKPACNVLVFQFPGREAGLSLVYLLAGLYCCISALALAPYRAFYAMATVGVISSIFRIIERRNREQGDGYFSSRKHSHKH